MSKVMGPFFVYRENINSVSGVLSLVTLFYALKGNDNSKASFALTLYHFDRLIIEDC